MYTWLALALALSPRSLSVRRRASAAQSRRCGPPVGSADVDIYGRAGLAPLEASASTNCTVLFAPEPKLQGFALQNPYNGAVLAEDFYAPTYLRMRAAYVAGNAAAALAEQHWKQDVR